MHTFAVQSLQHAVFDVKHIRLPAQLYKGMEAAGGVHGVFPCSWQRLGQDSTENALGSRQGLVV